MSSRKSKPTTAPGKENAKLNERKAYSNLTMQHSVLLEEYDDLVNALPLDERQIRK